MSAEDAVASVRRGRGAGPGAILVAAVVLTGCGSQAGAPRTTPASAPTSPPVAATTSSTPAPSGAAHATGTPSGGAAHGTSPAPGPAQAGRVQMKPQSPGGHASVSTSSGVQFTVTGSTCQVSGGQAVFFLGTTGSGDEVDIDIHSGYTGPGTYSGEKSDALINAEHAGTEWASSFDADPKAQLIVDPGARSGYFTYQSDVHGAIQSVTGSFVCG